LEEILKDGQASQALLDQLKKIVPDTTADSK
jgi:hypothetical protein